MQENPTRPFQEALDELPFPDRELWRPWIQEEPKHALLVGRGCPFSCGYCSNHALRQLADGKYVRLRSPGSVLAELRALCAEFPRATYVYFEIETITADQRWALELAALLEEFNAARAEPLDFAINLRVLRGVSFAELFAALKRAGFSYLRIGIESGSERVRREILHRDHTNQDLVATFEDAHRAGLETYAYNLIGLPGETPADFLETVELNRRCAATRSYISIFYPYPGTDLERVCAERGIRVPALVDSAERYRARLGLPEFPNRQVERYFRRFHSLVSGQQEPLSRRLDAYVWQTLNGYPRLARWARRHTGHGVLSGLRRRWRALGAWLPTNGAKRS